jgi:tetratricopeptide (TPR) repeat protein
MTLKDSGLGTGEENLPGMAGTRRRFPSPPDTTGRSLGNAAPENQSGAAPAPPPVPPGGTTGREAIYDRVSALLEAGQLREAEELLARGLEIYPESVDLLKELGVLYHLQGRYGKAVRTFTRVMNITGEGRQSLSWKVTSLYHKALEEVGGPDPGRSIPTFDLILTLNPQDREALAGKIAAFRVLGRMDEARRCLQEGLGLDPPGSSILYQEGWLHMDLDRPDLAEEAFERAALIDPGWLDPVFSKALALMRLGRGSEAEKILQELLESGKGNPGLLAEIGWFSLALHDLGKAKEIFLELAGKEGDKGDIEGLHGTAAFLFAMGRSREAGVIMGRLAGALPKDPLVQANHGMVLAREGGGRNLADAGVAAKRALSLDPRFAAAHTLLGIVAFKQGRAHAAEAHFTDAIRLGDPAGYRNLGLLLCTGDRWEEAGPHLLRATGFDPLDARAWAGLGAVALHGGKAGEAALHLRKACALDPRDTGCVRGLAIALAAGGDTAGAEEVIRRVLDLTRGPGRWALLLDLAALLLSLGGPGGDPVLDEEASQVLAEAGSLRPGEPGILFYEGVTEGRLGHTREAIQRFASSMERGEYRVPAQENIRRLKKQLIGRKGLLDGISGTRTALTLLSLVQLGASWYLFVAGLVSETTLVLLLAIFSVLFALAAFVPDRYGRGPKEMPPELLTGERTFVPSPEADMVLPFGRLRTALRR